MTFENKVVWITGASSGIGESLARGFLKEGAKVILSSRNREKLEKVKANSGYPGKCIVLPLDLADSDGFRLLADQVLRDHGRVDVLVNNGGMGLRSTAIDTDLEVDRQIMEVNYFGHIALTKAVLPFMLAQKAGQIVVISSVMGKFGAPRRSAYAAAKHALHGFFECLRFELMEDNIGITLVNPGYIKTEFSVSALTGDGHKWGKMDEGQQRGISAKKCARVIIRGMKKGKHEIHVGGKEILGIYLKRYAPGLLHRKIASLKNS